MKLLGLAILFSVGLTTAAQAANTVSARGLLKQLPVTAEHDSDYDRDAFHHWISVPGKGCDTRQWVLFRQNRALTRACGDTTGVWRSAYDNQRFTFSSELDIDHMVPLAEAWGSGAWRWSDSQRESYANDLYPFSLIAVSASSNRSKSDRDPAEWMPPSKSFACAYLVRWVAVKYRWRLSVDLAERRAIGKGMSSCGKPALQLNRKIRRAKVPNSTSAA